MIAIARGKYSALDRRAWWEAVLAHSTRQARILSSCLLFTVLWGQEEAATSFQRKEKQSMGCDGVMGKCPELGNHPQLVPLV